MQREECVIRPVVRDETEKQEVRDLLAACDNDFVPPLSARSSTTQQSWEGAAGGDGVAAYAKTLLEQSVALWKQDGRTVGRPTVCYLSTLCVSPACRGQGLARRIYEAVIAWAHEQLPGRPIALRTWSTNAAQLRLMEKLGFTCVLRLPDDRGPGVDTVYYRLP